MNIEAFTYRNKKHNIADLLDYMDRAAVKVGLLDIIRIVIDEEDKQNMCKEVIRRATELMDELDFQLDH